MRAFALLLLCLSLSVPAGAGESSFVCQTTTQALTGSTPTASDDGAPLSEGTGYTVVVSAGLAATITGGSVLCWYRGIVSAPATGTSSTYTLRWMRCPTTLDFTPATGSRDAASGDYTVTTGVGRVKYVPSAVTLSAGTTVDVTICTRRRP